MNGFDIKLVGTNWYAKIGIYVVVTTLFYLFQIRKDTGCTMTLFEVNLFRRFGTDALAILENT